VPDEQDEPEPDLDAIALAPGALARLTAGVAWYNRKTVSPPPFAPRRFSFLLSAFFLLRALLPVFDNRARTARPPLREHCFPICLHAFFGLRAAPVRFAGMRPGFFASALRARAGLPSS